VRSRGFTVLVALLILTAFGRSAITACAGWDESAAVRAACCDTPECSQAAADDCCARGETRQHAQSLGPIAPGLIPAFHVIAVTEPVASRIESTSLAAPTLADRVDAYLLFSVFIV
jgi:hypothetical protein